MESAYAFSDRAEWVDNFAALNAIPYMFCIMSGRLFDITIFVVWKRITIVML